MRFRSQLSGVSILVKNSFPVNKAEDFVFLSSLKEEDRDVERREWEGWEEPRRVRRLGRVREGHWGSTEVDTLSSRTLTVLREVICIFTLWAPYSSPSLRFPCSLRISECVILQVVRGFLKVTEGSVHRGIGDKEAAEILGGMLWISTGHGLGGLLRGSPVWLQGCADISVALTHWGKTHPHTGKGRESSSLVVTITAHKHSRV